MTFACISAGAPRLWRSVMQIDQVSQEPVRQYMLTVPFHGAFFPLEVHNAGSCFANMAADADLFAISRYWIEISRNARLLNMTILIRSGIRLSWPSVPTKYFSAVLSEGWPRFTTGMNNSIHPFSWRVIIYPCGNFIQCLGLGLDMTPTL